MRHLTVRGVDPTLEKALSREQKRRGTSLNRTVIDLLRKALGLGGSPVVDNGLGKHAGGWTEEEFRRFERDTAFFEEIEEEPAP